MSWRTWFYVITLVLLLHGVAFYFLGHPRPVPKTRQVPKPNFTFQEKSFENSPDGNRTIYREFKVSTRIAEPATPAPK